MIQKYITVCHKLLLIYDYIKFILFLNLHYLLNLYTIQKGNNSDIKISIKTKHYIYLHEFIPVYLSYTTKYNDKNKTILMLTCADIKCSTHFYTCNTLNYRKKSLVMFYVIIVFIQVRESGSLNQTKRIYNIYGAMII